MMRKGSSKDFDQLFEIYMHEAVNPFLNFEIMAASKFKIVFDELRRDGELYVEEFEGRVAVTCFVFRHKERTSHVATLGTLAVHPQFHRRGLGNTFLNELFKMLKSEGIIRVDLLVEADNPKAISFYEKMGFEREGILKRYFRRSNKENGQTYLVDEYLMATFL